MPCDEIRVRECHVPADLDNHVRIVTTPGVGSAPVPPELTRPPGILQ